MISINKIVTIIIRWMARVARCVRKSGFYKKYIARESMPYKKYIIILLIIIAVIAVMFFAVLFLNKQDQAGIVMEREVFDIQELVDRINQKQGLSVEEKKYLEKVIENKLAEKTSELNKKSKEEKRLYGYAKEELKFIANPRKTVEEELGITNEVKKIKFYTQEELENIANPK